MVAGPYRGDRRLLRGAVGPQRPHGAQPPVL